MIKRNVAVLLVAGLVLGGGGVALAEARHAPAPLRRAVHGDLVVRGQDGRFESLTFDRGTVNEATDTSKLVLDRPDGKQVTLELTAETRYRGVEGAAQLREGERAMATSRDGKALSVRQGGPNKGPGKKPR
jgi:hypothetical protein